MGLLALLYMLMRGRGGQMGGMGGMGGGMTQIGQGPLDGLAGTPMTGLVQQGDPWAMQTARLRAESAARGPLMDQMIRDLFSPGGQLFQAPAIPADAMGYQGPQIGTPPAPRRPRYQDPFTCGMA